METNNKIAKWLQKSVGSVKTAEYKPTTNLRPWLDPKEFFKLRFGKDPEADPGYFDDWVKRLAEATDEQLLKGIMDSESKAVYDDLKAKADSKNKPANVVDINTAPKPEVKKKESQKVTEVVIATIVPDPTAEVKVKVAEETKALALSDLEPHIGHKIVITTYGDPAVNVSLECTTCHEVLVDFDK